MTKMKGFWWNLIGNAENVSDKLENLETTE